MAAKDRKSNLTTMSAGRGPGRAALGTVMLPGHTEPFEGTPRAQTSLVQGCLPGGTRGPDKEALSLPPLRLEAESVLAVCFLGLGMSRKPKGGGPGQNTRLRSPQTARFKQAVQSPLVKG